jgi:hypothetical protein
VEIYEGWGCRGTPGLLMSIGNGKYFIEGSRSHEARSIRILRSNGAGGGGYSNTASYVNDERTMTDRQRNDRRNDVWDQLKKSLKNWFQDEYALARNKNKGSDEE